MTTGLFNQYRLVSGLFVPDMLWGEGGGRQDIARFIPSQSSKTWNWLTIPNWTQVLGLKQNLRQFKMDSDLRDAHLGSAAVDF